MFSETRYALNGDLRVAYRASPKGPRDIVWVPNWHSCCEVVPELLSIQGWVEAMTSLGRLIIFDQPGTGVSDPVEPGALPTLEQWADSITAVLDDLGSREAVLVASHAALATAALFAATHPSRTTALLVLDGYADPGGIRLVQDEIQGSIAMWGSGKLQHLVNPDMPWNEEIRAAWARLDRLAASPRMLALVRPLAAELDVRAVLPTIRVPTLVVQHSDSVFVPPAKGKYIAGHIPDAKYAEVPGRNGHQIVEPWRESFQEIAEAHNHTQCAADLPASAELVHRPAPASRPFVLATLRALRLDPGPYPMLPTPRPKASKTTGRQPLYRPRPFRDDTYHLAFTQHRCSFDETCGRFAEHHATGRCDRLHPLCHADLGAN